MSLFCNMGILQHGKIEEVLMYVNEEPNHLRLVVGWIVDVVVVISIAWFVVFALGTQITVTGQSMEPAFVQGETVLMNRLSYMITGPDRMDIVAFEKEEGKYPWWFRAGVVLVYIIIGALAAMSMYIGFTAVGLDTVAGCQGRYIIPALFPTLFVLTRFSGRTYVKNFVKEENINCLAVSVLALFALYGVWVNCVKLY